MLVIFMRILRALHCPPSVIVTITTITITTTQSTRCVVYE